MQDHRPKEWNKIFFGRLIPMAWAKLLCNICQNYPKQDHSHLWPTKNSDPQQLWDGLCGAVAAQAFQNHLPVWFTDLGHITLEDGLLASVESHWKARAAFAEAKIPVIFMSNHLLDEARHLAESRTLTPRTLYQSLQGVGNLESLSSSCRLLQLEYLIGGIPLIELGSLSIFPFQDGNFRSLKQSSVFLHRDDLENILFARQKESTIDTDKLSGATSKLMHERVKQGERILRYRGPEDLRDCYLQPIADGSGDIIGLDEGGRATLTRVWMWIMKYCKDKLSLPAVGPLWLVPLRGSKVRRLVPQDTSNFVTWFLAGKVNDVALEIITSNHENDPKVLADDISCGEIWRHLRTFAGKEKSLCIKNGNNFENFLEFLAQGRGTLENAGEDVKISVVRALKQLRWSQSQLCTDRMRRLFQSLHIFKAVQWPIDASHGSLTRYWTEMTSGVAYRGLKKLLPVPSSPGQVFIDVTDDGERGLFEGLGILECFDEIQVLEKIAIPAISRGSYNSCLSSNFCLEVVKALFQNYYHISGTTRSLLPRLAVVPLQKQGKESSLSFGCPLDTLDPRQPALKKLYFEDEIALPEQQFYDEFSAILAECGMVKGLTDSVVLSRIRTYGKKDLDFGVVASRARELLERPFSRDSAQQEELTRAARDIEWLPARSPDRSDSFTSSSKCRDSRYEPFVGHVWHVLPFKVENSWISILGWQNAIDVDTLISQVTASIAASDIKSVEKTLSYLSRHHPTENYATRLLKLSFIRSSNGKLVKADNVCQRDGERLMPYLYTVDPRFLDTHSQLIKLLRIPELPSLEQLKNVQNALERRDALSEEDFDVAVELARIWGIHFPEYVDGLKVPSDSGLLINVADLVFNDMPLLQEIPCASVHPKVSRRIAEQLRIEPLSELLRNGALGIVDPDDDIFFAREEVADGIRDTLDRYSRESTFHEYLANADDCDSASQVNFLLDETNYGTKNLVSDDLQDLQGPSLLVHNNGGK